MMLQIIFRPDLPSLENQVPEVIGQSFNRLLVTEPIVVVDVLTR